MIKFIKDNWLLVISISCLLLPWILIVVGKLILFINMVI